jgi:hypothetical protein
LGEEYWRVEAHLLGASEPCEMDGNGGATLAMARWCSVARFSRLQTIRKREWGRGGGGDRRGSLELGLQARRGLL